MAKPSSGRNTPASKPQGVDSQPRPPKNTSKKAAARPSFEATITADDRVALYAVSRMLTSHIRNEGRLKIRLTTYLQDPSVARNNPQLGLDESVLVDWEPGLSDGPTSARFAIVDFNADTGELIPSAEWSEKDNAFTFNGTVLKKEQVALPQFRQASVWAILQRALEFFENGSALGRRIPWAFEGNRLIVVPHAGWGENAYYDRTSKSLQFYYCGSPEDPVYTCLSTDIVNHEFGHAVLDGVRPYFNESSQVQTAAFHESIGDIAAILLTMRNNELRSSIAKKTNGDLTKATTISSIAQEFGEAVSGRPYLRTALNKHRMSKMAKETEPHLVSEVLTGAMFDVLQRLAEHYQKEPEQQTDEVATVLHPTKLKATPAQAFWWAVDRMQRTAIQPLDLLPPVEVTFKDYAFAVCRAQQLAEPLDPDHYYEMLIEVFRKREILSAQDEAVLRQSQYLYDRLELTVYHDVSEISRSRAAAYRFLDDNREDLLIPVGRDFLVADLYDANKRTRQGARLPRQIILEYVWREDVLLKGKQFGQYENQWTTMLCGGTLVFNDCGNVLSWAMKPGSEPYGGKRERAGKISERWNAAVAEGARRRDAMLKNLAVQIGTGRVGEVPAAGNGLLGAGVPPLIAESHDNRIRFRLAPHLSISHHDHGNDQGARPWEISC